MHATLSPTPPPGSPHPLAERVLVDDTGAVVHVLRLFAAPVDAAAWEVRTLERGRAADEPPTVAQLTCFDGPRDARWTAANDRAGRDRLWPAVADLPGLVDVLVLRAADGATLVVSSATDREVLREAERRILSTELLPGEDPALLTGPDRLVVLDVAPAAVPAGAR